jgi:NAD(P)-dependent dehydrogenase (short-subunit alcohol dehydrogenase family)
MYGRTKLFNIMMSNEFNRRLHSSGVESFAVHPGVTSTDLYRKMDKGNKLSAKVGWKPT